MEHSRMHLTCIRAIERAHMIFVCPGGNGQGEGRRQMKSRCFPHPNPSPGGRGVITK
jgi:hypothetical protein